VPSRPLAWALLTTAGVLAWQALTVRFNHTANWTGLFHTGSTSAVPPALDFESIHIFQNDRGYDGQLYHYVAHDPLLRTDMLRYVDNPRLRWRRILAPGAAALLAGGEARWVDGAYFSVILGLVFAGAYWLSCWCGRGGLHPAWGLAFAIAPATIASVDRMTVDVALAALCLGFAVYSEEGPSWKVALILALAPLARETGLALPAAYAVWLLGQRLWRPALAVALALAPWAAWVVYVHSRTSPDLTTWLGWPLEGLLRRTLQPAQFPLSSPWLVKAAVLDYIGILGVWLALLLAAWLVWRRPVSPVALAAALFGLGATLAAKPDIWGGGYEFGRTMSPLIALVALEGVRRRFWWTLGPLALVAPRLLFQLQPQWKQILRALLG